MPMGHLTDEMLEAIRPVVVGKEVWDLGAGDGGHARTLLALGASRVFCVDKEPLPQVWKGITSIHARFEDIPSGTPIAVAFVSWPVNWPLPHLNRLVGQAERVIYLGSNTGGSACGTMGLFVGMADRQLLAHVPHYRNSLLVYGEPGVRKEPLTGEEWAMLSGSQVDFEEAQRLGR